MENIKDKIKEQVEYYFSNANYVKDAFLLATAQNNNGVVPISVLLTFNNLKAMNASEEQIREALEASDVVRVEEDGIRKIETEEFLIYKSASHHDEKCLYIKGFSKTSTIDEIKAILQSPKPVRISMKKNQKKEFTGNCVVEYLSKTDAELVHGQDVAVDVEEDEQGEDGVVKRVKKQNKLQIMYKEEFVKLFSEKKSNQNTENHEGFNGKWQDNPAKEKKIVDNIKSNFKRKLYKVNDWPENAEIKMIKGIVKGAAFVDLENNVIRMKNDQDWSEREFDGIKLTKMNEEEATAYLDSLNIKPQTFKRKHKNFRKMDIEKKNTEIDTE